MVSIGSILQVDRKQTHLAWRGAWIDCRSFLGNAYINNKFEEWSTLYSEVSKSSPWIPKEWLVKKNINFVDANVFAKFKPSKPLLRKMNLAQHIMSTTSIQESELALDLCSFLLRYHRGLDYGDFSENPYCVQRLRRYEDFKCWSEIEDVALLAETNSKDILSFK